MGDHRLEEWLSFFSLSIIIFDVFVLKMFLYSSNSFSVWSSLLSSLLLSLISHNVSQLFQEPDSAADGPLVWVRQRQTTDLIWKYHTPFLHSSINSNIKHWHKTDLWRHKSMFVKCLLSFNSMIDIAKILLWNVSSSFISELDISDSCKIYCWVVSWKRVKWCCWC